MGELAQMFSARNNDPRSRYIALTAVVALHVLLIQIAQRVALLSNRAHDEADEALVWLRLDQVREVPKMQSRTLEARVEVRERTAVPAQRRDSLPSQQHAAASLPPAPIDWRSNAARSAQLVVEGAEQERYRSFGPRKPKPPEEPQAPSIFGDAPKHKRGDVSGHVNDDPIVWVNENCYTTLDKSVQTARDWVIANPGSFAPPSINCVGTDGGNFGFVLPNPASFTPPSLNYMHPIGKKQANGKLFEHIKKPEEPPVPKTGTEMNELPERVEGR
jgi:hypothetical protein